MTSSSLEVLQEAGWEGSVERESCAASCAQPDLYEAIKDVEPVTPIAVYKYSAIRAH